MLFSFSYSCILDNTYFVSSFCFSNFSFSFDMTYSYFSDWSFYSISSCFSSSSFSNSFCFWVNNLFCSWCWMICCSNELYWLIKSEFLLSCSYNYSNTCQFPSFYLFIFSFNFEIASSYTWELSFCLICSISASFFLS